MKLQRRRGAGFEGSLEHQMQTLNQNAMSAPLSCPAIPTHGLVHTNMLAARQVGLPTMGLQAKAAPVQRQHATPSPRSRKGSAARLARQCTDRAAFSRRPAYRLAVGSSRRPHWQRNDPSWALHKPCFGTDKIFHQPPGAAAGASPDAPTSCSSHMDVPSHSTASLGLL